MKNFVNTSLVGAVLLVLAGGLAGCLDRPVTGLGLVIHTTEGDVELPIELPTERYRYEPEPVPTQGLQTEPFSQEILDGMWHFTNWLDYDYHGGRFQCKMEAWVPNTKASWFEPGR